MRKIWLDFLAQSLMGETPAARVLKDTAPHMEHGRETRPFPLAKTALHRYLLPIAILFFSAMHFWLAISGRFEPKHWVSGFAIAVLVQTHLQYKQQYDEDLEMFEQPITESLCEEQAKQVDDSPSYIRPVEGTVDCESFLSSLHAYRRLIMIGAGIPHEQLFQERRSGLGGNSTRADVVEWQPGARSGVEEGLSPNQKEVLSDR